MIEARLPKEGAAENGQEEDSQTRLDGIGRARVESAVAGLYGLQETLIGVAPAAPVGQQIEAPISRLDQGQPHSLATFDAGHLSGGLKACAGRGRSRDLHVASILLE